MKEYYRHYLKEVGIVGVKLPLRVKRPPDLDILLACTIDLLVSVTKYEKRMRLSKLQRSLVEILVSCSEGAFVEEIGEKILDAVYEKDSFNHGTILFSFQYPLDKTTPISKYKLKELYSITIKVEKIGKDYFKTTSVEVVGCTKCPHAGHEQRAFTKISFRTANRNEVLFGDLVKAAEESFSSNVNAIVRTTDERYLVEQRNKNKKFIEEVARDTLTKLLDYCKHKNYKAEITVESVADDSIHPFSVKAIAYKQISDSKQ